MVDDIISAVTGMAGVKADSQLVIVYNAVINLLQALQIVRPISEPFPAMVSSANYDREYLCQDRVDP